MRKYLKANSHFIKPMLLKELARGGEAIVYRVEHTGLDEVVAKIANSSEVFEDLIIETHTLKLLKNKDCIAEVKEEIGEYDESTQKLSSYCVIVEKA
jgi:predicted Ser/Thr protein kinase